MMDVRFEKAFLKAVKKYSGIKKQIERKVLQIIEHPVELGEPLKGNFRGFYSCPVKRNFIIIYLYCRICRKKSTTNMLPVQNVPQQRKKPSNSSLSALMTQRMGKNNTST